MQTSMQRYQKIREISEAGTAIALSVVLGNLRLLELPNGGSIAFGCVPLLAFAALYGWRKALPIGFAAGAIHALLGGTVVHPIQFLLDYGLGYAAMSLGGLRIGQRTAIILAFVVRYVVFVTSGTVFFAQYAGAGNSAVVFSMAYNATTVVPEAILVLLVMPRVIRAYSRATTGPIVGAPTLRASPAITQRAAVTNTPSMPVQPPAVTPVISIVTSAKSPRSATEAISQATTREPAVAPFPLRRPSALRDWRAAPKGPPLRT